MAVTIFSKSSGVVAAFNDPTLPATTTLRVEDWGGFSNFKSIITRVSVSSQGNFQFLHTLGGNIYVYVFGDRIGQLAVSGIACDATCDEEAGELGIERVIAYYNANRIAARKTPIKITLGVRTTLAGYLVGISAEMANAQMRMYQFNLQFVIVPQSSTPCSAITGSSDKPTTPVAGPVAPEPPGTFTPSDPQIGNGGNYDLIRVSNIEASGYDTVNTGPNINMVKPQVH